MNWGAITAVAVPILAIILTALIRAWRATPRATAVDADPADQAQQTRLKSVIEAEKRRPVPPQKDEECEAGAHYDAKPQSKIPVIPW